MDEREVADRLEIADVLARYARAVDAGEWDRLSEVFTSDAVIDYRAAGGIVGGLAEVRGWLAEVLARWPGRLHLIGAPVVDFIGADADGRAGVENGAADGGEGGAKAGPADGGEGGAEADGRDGEEGGGEAMREVVREAVVLAPFTDTLAPSREMTAAGAKGFCQGGGWYRHRMIRTPDGWRSRELVEEQSWRTVG
ncbi:nuclear transport factor 2 family protein [Nonomuraea mangrovi]|uniref:Nuclear transport factor 2 family protein n=1 Tax=Nonomuraea mangrovi TaxID=2316207 RepID=A0ABW4SRB9_9ACTN